MVGNCHSNSAPPVTPAGAFSISDLVGYDEVIEHSDELYDITGSIEKAVLWRSMPECAGSIIVFIRNDTDKLHSLAEFEVTTGSSP